MKFINKQEAKYITYSLAFALAWFFLALPFLQSRITSIPLQFLVFNVGLYFFLFIFLKSVITETKIDLKVSFGIIMAFLALDNLVPEYHINTLGQLIPGATLGTSATDYFLGTILQGLGFSGGLLFFMVYIVSTGVLLFLSALLLKNLVKNLG